MIKDLKLKRGQKVTFEEIKEFGDKLKIADKLITECLIFSSQKFGKTSPTYKALYAESRRLLKIMDRLDDHIGRIEMEGFPEDRPEYKTLNEIFFGDIKYEIEVTKDDKW